MTSRLRSASTRSVTLAVIALDSSALVPLFIGHHVAADGMVEAVRQAALRGDTLVTPVFCTGEFWRVTTEPRGYGASTSTAGRFLLRWVRRAPLVHPRGRYWAVLNELIVQVQPRGAAIFDCQIAAVCIEHGVDEIWTIDARFPRDQRLRVVNPLGPES